MLDARWNPGAAKAPDVKFQTGFALSHVVTIKLEHPPRSTAERCLLRGRNPSTSLRKDCASRFLSMPTAESGIMGGDVLLLRPRVGSAGRTFRSRPATKQKRAIQGFRGGKTNSSSVALMVPRRISPSMSSLLSSSWTSASRAFVAGCLGTNSWQQSWSGMDEIS
jgi:hypothetical protein